MPSSNLLGTVPSADPVSRSSAAPVDLSVVVPVLDEREALEPLQREIETACAPLGLSFQVIWVDDGSTDGTTEVLERLAREHASAQMVRLRRNFGKSAALRAGLERSSGAAVITMDGDGQDDPAEIQPLLAKLDEGYDVVSGWKQQRRDPPLKRWGSRLFNRLTAKLSGVPLHDVNCGLKAYRGPAVRSLELYGEQHRFIPVLGFQRGWRVAEIPVHHRPREHGRSKFGAERYARGLLDLFSVLFIGRYQYRPLHLFGGAGLISLFLGVLVCAYLTVVKLTGEPIGDRPLLFLGVLLIIAGIQLFTLGLVGEMITATRQDVLGSRSSMQTVERVVEGPEPAQGTDPALPATSSRE